MVQLSQIYEKSVRKVLAFFGLILLLNSCASKSTSLFELQNQSVLNESKQTSNPTIQIEKKSVYILGIFTTGEYDRFEGNIFDQLRISLYSEARYKYPEYELTNVSQEESYRFFKTTYSVKGQLVSNKQMRERLHLISGALAQLPPSKPSEGVTNAIIPEETQVEEIVVSDQKSSMEIASTQEVVKMFEKVVNQEPSEIIEPVAIIEEPKIEEVPSSALIDQEPSNATEEPKEAEEFFESVVNQEPSEIIESVAIVEEPQIEEIPSSALVDQEPITAIDEPKEAVEFFESVANQEPSEIIEPVGIIEESQIEEVPSSALIDQEPITEIEEPEEAEEFFESAVNQEPSEIIEPVAIIEEPQIEEIPVTTLIDEEPIVLNEVSPLMGKTVYIVASFPRQGFVEEKVEITQAEVGYPLAYYKTDGWIRVYLDGEFNNVIEAMEVFDDAWPIQYGN